MRDKLLDKEDADSKNDEIFTPAVKKKVLVAILVQILIGNMMVSNLVAFLPTYVQDADWEVVNGV
jgi:hypothetical protein